MFLHVLPIRQETDTYLGIIDIARCEGPWYRQNERTGRAVVVKT